MPERMTMGAYLRAARRRRRVSIERAAEDTRIRAGFLMRMESDEFDFLAPAYVRGFLRSYARY
ncbi:MAG: helix-turn-helix domain-containing protein, partial [Actinomycetota bacterium]